MMYFTKERKEKKHLRKTSNDAPVSAKLSGD